MFSGQPRRVPEDGVAWYCKLLARVIGTLGGVGAMVLGLFAAIGFSAICIVAGILTMVSGFIVVLLEAPACCPFLEFIDKIAQFSESRPYWQKATLYALLAIIPFILCQGLTQIGASLCILVAAVIYGILAIGRKADAGQMREAAAYSSQSDNTRIIDNEQKMATDKPNMGAIP